MTENLNIEVVEQQSELLGRQLVHDERSRAFPMSDISRAIDRSTWRDRLIRLYEPYPNPNQRVGCCTGVAKASQLNAVGNRVRGRVLTMKDAENMYARNTEIDPWDGSWPPQDTGSSALASCKTAREFGLADEYRWLFEGADEVVQNIMQGRVISIGTWWHWDMFDLDKDGRAHVGGGRAGGHQYVARGYDVDRDWILCRNWWGDYRDFWITRLDLDALLRDGGDAHFQESLPN